MKALQDREATLAASLRAVIRRASSARRITPEAVFAYARLHLRTEEGFPILPAPHHRLWVMLLCDTRIKKLLIIAPPGSAKTSWTISAFCGVHVGIFPEYPIIIGSVTTEVAERRALSLRAMVETDAWQQTFPGIKPVRGNRGLAWETHQWSVAPDGIPYPGRIHPTVAATGTFGTVIGSRGRLLIGDDLLDFDSTRTAVQRQNTKDWAYSSFFSRGFSGIGRIVLIGNAWHHDDLYARAREEGGWVVCHTPLLSGGDEASAYLTYPDDWGYAMAGEPLATDPYELVPTD